MLTRRDFMGELAVAGAAVTATPANVFAAIPGVRTAVASIHAVVSIHMDQPYLDATGRELPYLPPDGVRAGMPVAHLSETEFRWRFVYL
jgi:hypothetical protein